MNRAVRLLIIIATAAFLTLLSSLTARAQNWPQWRGTNRDAKVTGFKAPAEWPKELTQKWKVTVGEGPSTPALVGDKLYVFARQESNEIIRCLDAATGNEVWKDQYAADAPNGPSAAAFSGPRSSPAVEEGKVVTLGVRGVLSCYDAATGKKLWSHDDFAGQWPRFFTASSPIITEGQCIAQLGGNKEGAIVSYDLNTGEEKWRWTGDGPAYSSPMLLTIDGTSAVVAMTEKNIVAISPTDQKILWQVPFPVARGGYNAATPIINSNILIYSGSGRGTKAIKLEKEGSELNATELWTNPDISVQFNTPVLKDGLLYGFSSANTLFCLSAADGKTAWNTPRMESGGSRPGYGSVVDCGPVLMALNPAANLMVFEPTDKEFKQLATYKVADGDTYAYPIISGNRIFIKDKTDVILWTLE
jgi:outer membrane protein assembly factor BamB